MGRRLTILGLHIRDSPNAGDRWSSPLEYLSFPGHEVVMADMRRPPDIKADVVIYGGGSIVSSPDFRRWSGAVTIGWGVGHHERTRPWIRLMRSAHTRASELCDLYFARDELGGFEYAPCASCLHPVFDDVMRPRHSVVRYSAARRVAVNDPSDAPHMTNEDGDIVQAVQFLASGETVVTSSYHGAYWASLLGRNVEIVEWGSKFEYVPRQKLGECRQLNHTAYWRVAALIERVAAASQTQGAA